MRISLEAKNAKKGSKCYNYSSSVEKIMHAWTPHMSSSSVAYCYASCSSTCRSQGIVAEAHTGAQCSTRRQQQVRECHCAQRLRLYCCYRSARSHRRRAHAVAGESVGRRIPTARHTATARVSQPTASLNAPYMCSYNSAISPMGLHSSRRWTSGMKFEAKSSPRFLCILDHQQRAMIRTSQCYQ
jgi:hypothetical protein